MKYQPSYPYPTVVGPRGTRELAPCSGARRMHLALADLYAKWQREDAARRLAAKATTALAAFALFCSAPAIAKPVDAGSIERTIVVKLSSSLPANVHHAVTSQTVTTCTAVAATPDDMLAAYRDCAQRLSDGQPRTPTTPRRGLQCVPRDVLEVVLTGDHRRVVATLWDADGNVVNRTVHDLDDPLSTLWDY